MFGIIALFYIILNLILFNLISSLKAIMHLSLKGKNNNSIMTSHFCTVFVTVSFYGHPFPNTYFELILMAFLTKVSRFQRNILLFSFCLFLCILLISYKHCLRDFSITTWPIYIKLLDLNNNDLKLFAIFFNDDVTSGFET